MVKLVEFVEIVNWAKLNDELCVNTRKLSKTFRGNQKRAVFVLVAN